MKKSKRMVLFLFALHILAGKNAPKTYAYIDLYRLLPLAQSTIRGIVMEFLSLGFLEEKVTLLGKSFQISKSGILEAREIFSLADGDEVTLIITQAVSSRIESLGFFSLRPGVYIRFGRFDPRELGILPKSVLSTLLICTDVQFEERSSLRTLHTIAAGEEIIMLRKNVHRTLTTLSMDPRLHGGKHSRSSKPQSLLLGKSYVFMLECFSSNYRIPDSYYPNDLRLHTLLELFCSTVNHILAN